MTPDQKSVIKWLLKNGSSPAKAVGEALASHVKNPDDWARSRLNTLHGKGWVMKLNPPQNSDPVLWSATPEGRAAVKAERGGVALQ